MSDVTVLIVAQHTVIGALLGSLIELAGHKPEFPETRELASTAIARLAPRLTLLDSDHPLSTDPRLFDAARVARSAMLMFSSSLNGPDTAIVAAERHLPSFTLPIKYRDFVNLIDRTLQPPPIDLALETSGEHGAAASL